MLPCGAHSESKTWFLCLRSRSSEPPGANAAVVYPALIICYLRFRRTPFCCPSLHDGTLRLCQYCLTVAANDLVLSPEQSSHCDYHSEPNKSTESGVYFQYEPPRQPGEEAHEPLELNRKRPKVMEAVNLHPSQPLKSDPHRLRLTISKKTLLNCGACTQFKLKPYAYSEITSLVNAPNMGSRLISRPSSWNSLNRTNNLSKFVLIMGSSRLTDSFENIFDIAARRVRCKS